MSVRLYILWRDIRFCCLGVVSSKRWDQEIKYRGLFTDFYLSKFHITTMICIFVSKIKSGFADIQCISNNNYVMSSA